MSRRFQIGQRVRPSQYGIRCNIFPGVWRGVPRAERTGVVVRIDRFGSPTVIWDGMKTPYTFAPDFIAPDYRKGKPHD